MSVNIAPGPFRVKIQPMAEVQDFSKEPSPLLDVEDVKIGVIGAKANRGVIVEVSPTNILSDDDAEAWGFLKPGVVVYYKGGYVIGEHIFIEVASETIIGYEV